MCLERAVTERVSRSVYLEGLTTVERKTMITSSKLLDYFNRKKSKSTDKHHTRFRNDICNHWDLDYLSLDEIEEKLKNDNVETTIARKRKDN